MWTLPIKQKGFCYSLTFTDSANAVEGLCRLALALMGACKGAIQVHYIILLASIACWTPTTSSWNSPSHSHTRLATRVYIHEKSSYSVSYFHISCILSSLIVIHSWLTSTDLYYFCGAVPWFQHEFQWGTKGMKVKWTLLTAHALKPSLGHKSRALIQCLVRALIALDTPVGTWLVVGLCCSDVLPLTSSCKIMNLKYHEVL
jgi:hypothetical protein